jgi:hypothetical protein
LLEGAVTAVPPVGRLDVDNESLVDRTADRPAYSVHGVLTIAVLLGVYIAALHVNDYPIDVVCVSFITGSIAIAFGISGAAVGFVIGRLFGRAKRGMYFGALVALTAVLLLAITFWVLVLFLVVIAPNQ